MNKLAKHVERREYWWGPHVWQNFSLPQEQNPCQQAYLLIDFLHEKKTGQRLKNKFDKKWLLRVIAAP